MKTKPSFRELNLQEKEILNTLLEKDFKGRTEIKEQIHTATVRKCCDCGCNSIEFSITSNTVIPSTIRVSVEASYFIKEKPFQILLHVIKGKVSELELVSYSDLIATDYPKKDELKVKINEN